MAKNPTLSMFEDNPPELFDPPASIKKRHYDVRGDVREPPDTPTKRDRRHMIVRAYRAAYPVPLEEEATTAFWFWLILGEKNSDLGLPTTGNGPYSTREEALAAGAAWIKED